MKIILLNLLILSLNLNFFCDAWWCGDSKCDCAGHPWDCCTIGCCSSGQGYSDGHCHGCSPGQYCPDGYNFNQCGPGSYQPNAWQTGCIVCPQGSYCPAGSANPTQCPDGHYCPARVGGPISCPEGWYCPTGSSGFTWCPPGYYCPAKRGNPIQCPGGSYCPGGTGATLPVCPAGRYCPQGSIAPISCSAGTYSQPGASQCIQCPGGFYCPVPGTYEVIPCGKGKHCPPGSIAPKLCPAGTSSTAETAADLSSCISCPLGSFAYSGATTCTPCSQLPLIKGLYTGPLNFTTHWTGGPLDYQCECDLKWTGTNCEIQDCPTLLPGFSLGALLLHADPALTEYSKTYNSSKETLRAASEYLLTYLGTVVDISGDGNITRTEMTNALKYRGIFDKFEDSDVTVPLWCRHAGLDGYCYQDYPDLVQVSDMYADAISNYKMTKEHYFDGSGVSLIDNMVSSFPNASWSVEQCKTFRNPKTGPNLGKYVSTSWSYNSGGYVINRSCGYINGLLNEDLRAGRRNSITDTRDVTVYSSYRRVYCVSLIYQRCIGVVTPDGMCIVRPSLQRLQETIPYVRSYKCSTGLFYDGTPLDLQPRLTNRGVTFSYLDTSYCETEFDIFAGDYGSVDESKNFIVGINYPSYGCGRISRHVSFVDALHSLNVGSIVEYGVRALQCNDVVGAQALTNMTITPYRIPFLVQVGGFVQTKFGTGVKDVLITYCHIDPLTGESDKDSAYCPHKVFVTDTRGYFTGEIRVSNVKWVNMIETFNVTASKVEVLPDGSLVTHTFQPSSTVLALNHAVGVSEITIIDQTSITIFGRVLFDRINVGDYECPFKGVPITYVSETGSTTELISGPDGRFNISATQGEKVTIMIPNFNGFDWRSEIVTSKNDRNIGLSDGNNRRRLIKVLGDFTLYESTNMKNLENTYQGNMSNISSITMPSNTSSDVPTFYPSFVPTLKPSYTSIPTIVPSYTPTMRPSYSPSDSPTMVPSYTPTMKPSYTPTSGPTIKPTYTPTFSPTLRPSTSSPTIYIYNESIPQLMHVFKFNDPFMPGAVPGEAIVVDSISNATATLYGVPQVYLKDGKVKFQPFGRGYAPPYIKLPYASLNLAEVITVEIWVEFDAFNDPLSTLFSFGQGTDSISYLADFTGASSNKYIVVVYNSIEDYGKVYIDGVLSESVFFNSTNGLLGGLNKRLHDNFDFIGRSAVFNNHSLTASIDEFRIWYGELSSTTIYSNYLIGLDQSHIIIPSSVTYSNINVTFYSTSMQTIRVSLVGGLTAKSPMFGPETTFLLKPLGDICPYSLVLSLDSISSSVTKTVSAMNYTVTLLSAPPAPIFHDDVCDYSTGLKCFCDSSQAPLNFLTEAGQITQNITITNVTDAIYLSTFTYRSGVCMQLLKSDLFAFEEPKFDDKQKSYCIPNEQFTMKTGDNFTVTVVLFERYPETSSWIRSGTTVDDQSILIEKYVPESEVTILDLVSSLQSPFTVTYNSTLILVPPSWIPRPVGYKHMISAGTPRLSKPYSYAFQVNVNRLSPGQPSRTGNIWYIPVIGSEPKEVPNVYPIATDPTLIYLVIRDPPGGASYTSVHAGTSVEFDMSIEGMDTFGGTYGVDENSQFGANLEFQLAAAPLGIGTISKTITANNWKTHKSDFFANVSTYKGSSSHYRFSFNFEYDFSTSSDPFIAGHPSDVIIGGGVDIVTMEARNVFVSYQDDTIVCLSDGETNVWQPGKITTFILPVIEIQRIINELTDKIARNVDPNSINPDDTKEVQRQLQKQIDNWKQVLKNYRSHNTELTSLFSAQAHQYSALVSLFDHSKAIGGGVDEFIQALDNSGIDRSKFLNLFQDSFTEISSTCKGLGKKQSPFQSSICSDFDSTAWNSLYTEITASCSMPYAPDGKKSALRDSALVKEICKSGVIDSDVPGGVPSSLSDRTTNIFSFLKDSNKYVTYSSNSPVTLKWTSEITDSMTFDSGFDAESSKIVNDDLLLDNVAFGVKLYYAKKNNRNDGLSISIGRHKSSTHKYERQVTVHLDDNDQGDFFVVRLTEDPVYGTPVFTTFGGESKCPGETATSRRESNVKISQIIPRCGPQKNAICTSLNVGETAHFGIVIFNNSPTGDAVDYTLRFKSVYDDFNMNSYSNDRKKPGYCGTPGQRAGLVANFPMTDLQEIPYNREIEIPFSITLTSDFICNVYQNIAIEIVATCEHPTVTSRVYQYSTNYDPTSMKVTVNYDEDTVNRGSKSSATFSVGWTSGVKPAGMITQNLLEPSLGEAVESTHGYTWPRMDLVHSMHYIVLILNICLILCIVIIFKKWYDKNSLMFSNAV